MEQRPLVIFSASYDSEDRATDDFSAVQRLQRDGVIQILDGAVIVRDAQTGALSRAPVVGVNGEQSGAILDWLLGEVSARAAALSAAAAGVPGPTTSWTAETSIEEVTEQLSSAGAAVVVVGEARLTPLLRVALARATCLLAMPLSEESLHLAGLQAVANASA